VFVLRHLGPTLLSSLSNISAGIFKKWRMTDDRPLLTLPVVVGRNNGQIEVSFQPRAKEGRTQQDLACVLFILRLLILTNASAACASRTACCPWSRTSWLSSCWLSMFIATVCYEELRPVAYLYWILWTCYELGKHWRRRLWGTGARAPPRLTTI